MTRALPLSVPADERRVRKARIEDLIARAELTSEGCRTLRGNRRPGRPADPDHQPPQQTIPASGHLLIEREG